MANIVLMPKMNLEMIEGLIGSWDKKEGDRVVKDEPLCEVENEKEVAPVYSSYEGIVVKHIYEEGDTCPCGKPLCIVAEEGEDWQEEYKKAIEMKNEVKAAFTIDRKIVKGGSSNDSEGAAKMSPKIRKLLRDNGISIEEITARFPGVKITEKEINDFKNAPKAASTSETKQTPLLSVVDEEGDERVKMSTMRNAIAKAMTTSSTKTAKVTNVQQVDMSRVVSFVKEQKAAGNRISYAAIVVKACALALREHRTVNAVLDESTNEIVLRKAINVGCATDSDAGLVVPVIKNADQKSLIEISNEIRELSEKVRNRTLTADERKGGTFTVTSVGMFDTVFFTPIINYPESAILGFGKIDCIPVFADDTYTTIVPKHVMYISLSYDHRTLDGGPAMKFMCAVRDILEKGEDFLK